MINELPKTKDQRHTAYILMHAFVETRKHFAFCWVADKLFGIELDNDFKFGNFKKYFPELYNLKDRTENDAFLWDNTDNRREALQQAINQTA